MSVLLYMYIDKSKFGGPNNAVSKDAVLNNRSEIAC